ncbi:uncharacterized protein LOC135077723 [Ostrinia nubilalis]|uniref:uncharacterized protein LOC135077723 n=1 Tax=Ostrinia nubilalis TaxID=29057 RepID=UPI0030824412
MMMSIQQGILPPKLQEAIETIIKNEDFIHFHIDVKELEMGSSFLGTHREINIRGETANGSKELKLFTKTKIDDVITQTTVVDVVSSVSCAYKKETFVYSELRRAINEVQEEANIPVGERYKLAKSYYSTDIESVIMENLREKGFTMCSNLDVIPLKIAELAIQRLAQFHSFAFILKEKRPKFFENKVKKMKQPFHHGTKPFNEFLKGFSEISINSMKPEQKKRLQEYFPTTYDKYEKYTQDPAGVWTLVHGDFRVSNVMVKYQDGEASEVIPVDYQHSYYGCSIVDFIYFIFCSTDQEFRKNHLVHLKNLYYLSMKNFLRFFNIDIEQYYPRAEFERLYKERLDYGLMMTLWVLPIILTKKDEASDAISKDLPKTDTKLNGFVQKRLSDIVDDFINWGYI